MIAQDDAPPCAQCGGETSFVLQIQPSGAEAGARIYYCPTCRHHTWEDLRNSPSRAPSRPAAPTRAAQPQQQPQQQQQAQSGEDEPGK
jgi:hypothetical protein